MTRIALGIAAAIALLTAIVLFRTEMAVAPPVSALAAASANIDPRPIARHLAEAVRFQTISYGGGAHADEKDAALDAMRAWMEKTYPDFHKVATREVFDHSLLFTWKGKNPDLAPVLLMAHMDVAPVVPGTEKHWAHAPFSGDIADGYVWGRGSIDDKAMLILMLEAAERLARQGFTPARTIMFAFGQDEENGGGKGSAVMAQILAKRGVHFAWVLDEGGAIVDEPFPGIEQPVAFVAVAEKGDLSLRLTAHGTGGHSSRPTGDMAIVRLARAVTRVVDDPFRSGLDPLERAKLSVLAGIAPFPTRMFLSNLWLMSPIVEHYMRAIPDSAARLHTTIAPTMLTGGVKDNVLPPQASAVINFRLHPRDTIAGVIAHVRAAIHDPKVDVTPLTETQDQASKVSDLHSPAGEFVAAEIRKSFGNLTVAPDMFTGATDSRHYLPISDQVFRFDPFHFGIDDLARVHGTNERLAVGELGHGTAFFMRLMKDLR
ncbi:MAG: M20 family peptidase [Rhizomicrobium sp.]